MTPIRIRLNSSQMERLNTFRKVRAGKPKAFWSAQVERSPPNPTQKDQIQTKILLSYLGEMSRRDRGGRFYTIIAFIVGASIQGTTEWLEERQVIKK